MNKTQNTNDSETVAINFETRFNPHVSFKTGSLSPWHQCRNIGWDCPTVSMTFGRNEQYTGTPENAPWELCEGKHWISHGVVKNQLAYERLVETGRAPKLSKTTWDDTADLAAYMRGPRDIGETTPHLLAEENRGASPVKLSHKLWDIYNVNWPEQERKLSRMTANMQFRGIGVDTNRLEEACHQLEMASWRCRRQIPWAFECDEIKLRQAIARECRKRGLRPPDSTSASNPSYLKWLRDAGPKGDFIKALVANRPLVSALQFLKKMQQAVREDGRMDVGLKYHGAHTGRWQGQGGLNLQGIPRDAVAGINLRSLIVPGPGKKFIIADLAQIEPRCLAWVVDDDDFLEKCRLGDNPYDAHARLTMGYNSDQPLAQADPKLYKLSKARILGLGYGCGHDRFKDLAKDMAGLNLTEEEASEAVKDFRKSNPRIVSFWQSLEQDFRNEASDTWQTELPSGRKLYYFQCTKGRELQASTLRHGPPKKLWGGVLVQNLIQAIARDVFADALLRLEEKGWSPAFHIHDEVILEVDTDVTTEAVEAEMVKEIPWMPGLPLAVEVQESLHFL